MISRIIRMFFVIAFITVAFIGSQAVLAQGKEEQESQSLYYRLGGLAQISVVVSDLVEVLSRDSLLNLNPAYTAARKQVQAPYLKYQFTSMVCKMTGGPCQYQGRGMKESHAHLNITEAEWDRMVVILKDILAKYHVAETETRELLEIISTTKTDIVVSEGPK